MRFDYIAQPAVQFGNLIIDLLETSPIPDEVTIVSAFADYRTLLRLRRSILGIKNNGAIVRAIVGIDMAGTSENALREILSWQVDARIVKNRRPGHTFHPKIYVFKRARRADFLIGSNNLTEGGFFRNYEGAVHITYEFPGDERHYRNAKNQLRPFLDPEGPTTLDLTAELIDRLKQMKVVRSERELAAARRKATSGRGETDSEGFPLFGQDDMPPVPPLPNDILAEIVTILSRERRKRLSKKRPGRKLALRSSAEITPSDFYMILNKLQGPNIPGEARIPMEARDIAEEFWGWPTNYVQETRVRGKKARVYWNWRPQWRIIDVGNPGEVYLDTVRIYEYEDSSDFRFYSRRLVVLGANEGDIVRIRRIAEKPVEFECIMAKQGTDKHMEWSAYCTKPIRNSIRRYGFS